MQRASCVAQIIVDDLDNPVVNDDDVLHLSKSLRVRPNERVSFTDGAGRWRIGTWRDGGVEPAGDTTLEPRITPEITVGFPLLKGERTEWAIQKLTEVNVDRIILFTEAERGVVRWDAGKRERNLLRLRRVATLAAMQSRRVWMPQLEIVGGLDDAPAAAVIAQAGGESLNMINPTVIVGPEGGWSDPELKKGLPTVDLGPTIMRSETAAVAVGVRLCALRADE